MNDEPRADPISVLVVEEPEPIPKPVRKHRKRSHPPGRQVLQKTIDQRRADAIKRATEIENERKTRIPVRLGVGLEMFEGLVAIADRLGGGTKLNNVALRAMAIGMTHWARELKITLHDVPDEPLGVFERIPAAASAQHRYGIDEPRVQAELREAAQETNRERDELATQLHLTGRKRAFG